MISGPPDFNYREMRARADHLEADGFLVRFFDEPELGHAMPGPEVLDAALEWVDGPYRRERAREQSEAQMRLAAYFEEREDPVPRSEADRAALAEVIRQGPWTRSAWRALDLLQEGAGDS
jgi:hypothetical protein